MDDPLSIDEVRRFWDRRPCNLGHSAAPVGTRRFYDEVEARKYRVEPHIRRFAAFDSWRGRDVLEIGCGLGTETINFARAGARISAVDVSPVSVRFARQRAAVIGVRAWITEADAENLWRLEGPFDLIWSFGVVHHSPHPERILAEARRLIAPDGELRLMVYHRHSTKVAALVCRHPLLALRGGIDRAVAVQSEAQTGCPITATFTRREAQRLLAGAGFALVDSEVTHIFPYAIGPYREHRYVRRWYWRLVGPRLFAWLERHAGWHLLLVADPIA